MRSSCFFVSLLVSWVVSVGGAAPAAEVDDAIRHYHDEESGRIARLDETDPAKVRVQVRFPGDPGFFSLWQGEGAKNI